MLVSRFKQRFPQTITQWRYYASLSNIQDFHEKYNLPKWPNSKDPPPNQLFPLSSQETNLSSKEIDLLVKSIYNSYVKIYHPDISNNIAIYDEHNKLMDDNDKRARFDIIQKSYEIMKHPSRRNAFLRSDTTSWDQYKYKSGTSSFDAYRMANSHRKQYDFHNDEEFWKAGTWEDYYNMKYNRSPPTKEEFDKNKFKILTGVLIVMGITTTIQLLLTFDKSRRLNYELNLRNLKLMQEMDNNYDLVGDSTQLANVRKLLMHRRAKEHDVEKLRLMERQDAETLTNFARQQVDKFSIPPNNDNDNNDHHDHDYNKLQPDLYDQGEDNPSQPLDAT